MYWNHLRIESRTHDRFYLITETKNNANCDYKYNVQEYDAHFHRDEDKNCVVKQYAYCGIGQFCKTTEEAYDWIDKRDKEEG